MECIPIAYRRSGVRRTLADIEDTGRKEQRPTKAERPGPKASIDCQLAYDRDNHDGYYHRLQEWRSKQFTAYRIIIASCEGQARIQAEKHELGQIAFAALRELYEFIREPRPRYITRVPGLTALCHTRRQGSDSVEAFRKKVECFAEICAENGYELPAWMLCHFFRQGLKLGDDEEMALFDAENEGLATDLSMEAIISVLRKRAERLNIAAEWIQISMV